MEQDKEVIRLLGPLRELLFTPFLTINGINLIKLFPLIASTGICNIETIFCIHHICNMIGNGEYFKHAFEKLFAANYCHPNPDGLFTIIPTEEAIQEKLIYEPLTTNATLILHGISLDDPFIFALNYDRIILDYDMEWLDEEEILINKVKDCIELSLVNERFSFTNFLRICCRSPTTINALVNVGLNPVIPWVFLGMKEHIHKYPFWITIDIYLFIEQAEQLTDEEQWPKHEGGPFAPIIKDIILSKLICGRRLIEGRCIMDMYPGIVTKTL